MNYHNITHDDQNNGDGLRVVLWVAGCDHHCKNCQNPQTWDPHSGIPFDEAAKQEIFNELSKDYISGITFSGGDPLHPLNIKNISDLISEISVRFPQKTIWMYTGFTWEECMSYDFQRDVVSKCDVLVDGCYIEAQRDISLHWRGSSNQRVIDVQKSLEKMEVVLYD